MSEHEFQRGVQPSEPEDAFERALRHAMRREEVRHELTAKLLAIAGEVEAERQARGGGVRLVKTSTGGRVLAFPRRHAWAGGAVAAALLVAAGLGVGGAVHVHQRHERAAIATRNFEQATAIEQQVLARTRQQLREQGVELGQ